MAIAEPTTIGLSDSAHIKLKKLKEDGHFAEMTDAYRFAVALALSHGIAPQESSGSRQTIFNVGTFDPDGSLYAAVATLYPIEGEAVYRTAERLAEWGVEELSRMAEKGALEFNELLEAAEQLVDEVK